jgi:hypothetical protein
MNTHLLAVALAAAAALPAQQTKVVPAGMDHVEGPSVYTYPFGRADGGAFVLYDASQITQSVAAITHMRFRPTQQTQTSPSYTKNYRVTAYTVTMNAATMAALGTPFDPNLVIGGATGTVVFLGPLVLPATAPLTVMPAPFSITIPFSPVLVFDSAQGNLLILVETADTNAVPGTYRIDAVQFRNSVIEGTVADIDTGGCTAGGASLALSTAATSAVLGMSMDQTVTASAAGAFPVALAFLSLDRQDTDLTTLGMPSCTARIGFNAAFQLLLETPGGHPHAFWPLPSTTSLEGTAVFTQVLGLPPNGTLNGAVVSNGQATRIGLNAFTPIRAQAAFRSSAGTFQGAGGQFVPVVQFEGAF